MVGMVIEEQRLSEGVMWNEYSCDRFQMGKGQE